MFEIKLPELGEGIEKATVAYWHCRAGDAVREGDDVVEVVTDKAVFNISAESNGIVKRICVDQGDEAGVGSVLAVLEG